MRPNPRIEMTWVPFLALLHREIWRFLKVVVQTIVTPMINSTLYLMIFGVSLGKSIQMISGVSYLEFLIPGLVMMSALNNSFQNASSSISIAKFQGELEDLKAAPLSPQQIIWALSLASVVRGMMVGTVTFMMGMIFYYFHQGEFLRLANPGWVLFFVVGGGLSFAQLGVSVAVWARSFDQLNAVGAFVLLPLIYLGGVFFSLESLHPFWQSVSQANPLLYFINGMRYGILGISDVSITHAALVTLISLGLFHWMARQSIRTGEFGRW